MKIFSSISKNLFRETRTNHPLSSNPFLAYSNKKTDPPSSLESFSLPYLGSGSMKRSPLFYAGKIYGNIMPSIKVVMALPPKCSVASAVPNLHKHSFLLLEVHLNPVILDGSIILVSFGSCCQCTKQKRVCSYLSFSLAGGELIQSSPADFIFQAAGTFLCPQHTLLTVVWSTQGRLSKIKIHKTFLREQYKF